MQGLGAELPPTLRQCQVLGSYIRCGTATGAATRLGLSPKTVESHLSALRQRLGAHNEGQAVHLVWLAYTRHARRCAERRHFTCGPMSAVAGYFREFSVDI